VTKTVCCLLLAALPASTQQTTVPLIVEGNAPIVELSFTTASGSLRKARFLVDTGGGAFLIGSQLMADIGAKAAGPEVQEEGERYQPLLPFGAKLGDIDLDLKGVSVSGLPHRVRVSSRNDTEGLLPSRLLRKYSVVFDYPAQRFTLAKSGSLQFRGVKTPSPISKGSGFPRLELRIGGVTYGFLLDTGASFTMISRKVLDQWARANPAWPAGTGAVGFANMFGGAVENAALMLRIPGLNFQSIEVANAAAVSREEGVFEKWMSGMMTGPIVGALAGNVLRDFRIQIDYQKGFTYFERAGTSSDADLTSVGIVLTVRPDGDLMVTGISSKAASDVKSAVLPGDKLLAIDGVPMTGKPLAVAAGALSGNAGSHKQLSLERGAHSLVVTVTVAGLL
jgi:predicted aspartyl protease